MAKRLWDKGKPLNERVHRFTVGNDPEVDLHLVRWDAIGSAAHARMLYSIGVLSAEEQSGLLSALAGIVTEADNGKFKIPAELEDCHGAIEAALTAKVGDAGKKIHTARSRNDQVLLAVRLFARNEVASLLNTLSEITTVFEKRITDVGAVSLPGYSHMQPAMPTSVGMWLHAFLEWQLELIRDGLQLLDSLDANPLGAASGFGVPLEIDRELTTKLLSFSRTQRSPIDIQNSRGRYEQKALRWASDIAQMIEKLSWDMILYSTAEFGFFKLPDELTTGSSIMPQKKNPDVLELLRARAGKVRAAETELQNVISKLPSNYHRDFQYTKEPLISGLGNISEMLPMLGEVIESFSINSERIQQSLTSNVYATYAVYRKVRAGAAFREAYLETAKEIDAGKIDSADLAADFSIVEAADKKELSAATAELLELNQSIQTWNTKLSAVETSVLTS